MKICVVGVGYVGLVGAAVFSDWGNEVVGVDIDKKKIGEIKKGKMPIYEPGLAEMVKENIKSRRLKFTTNLNIGMKNCDVVFICVGTPQSKTGAADLSYVWGAAKEIGKNIDDKKYRVIVTKSTVPVGTNERVKKIVKKWAPKDVKFDVVSNPEFLREGSSVEDMQNTDRTVIGAERKRAFGVMRKLYRHLNSPIVECDLRSAELIKYASNAFLAAKISFINEIAQLCEKSGADVSEVANGMGLDKRIGSKFLNAGIGYGGSCFPKDVAALRRTSLDFAYDFSLISGIMKVNDVQKHNFAQKIYWEFTENLSGRTLALLGLAFKDNTDDTRESVAIKIVHLLRGRGAELRVFDPVGMPNAKKEIGDDSIYYAKNLYDAMKEADALCILTEWEEFGEIDLKKAKRLLKSPVIFDGRNMLDQKEVEKAGFKYYAVGKRTNAYKDKKPYVARALLNGE